MFNSTNAFGQPASSPFGGPSVFGQTGNPNFGNAGSIFGGTSTGLIGATSFGQTGNPNFGNTNFGNTGGSIFGGTSTGLFGATSSSASASSFNATSSPAFTFGSSTPAFSASSNPASGFSMSGPTFGGFGSYPNQPIVFGSASQQTQSNFGSTVFDFGTSSQPAFATAGPTLNATSNAAFGVTSTPATIPNFSQPSPFVTQTFPFGVQTTLQASERAGISQSAFGGQFGGSRVKKYTPTAEVDGESNRRTGGKLQSISAMSVHKDKSHEGLRWEDYQLGDKGGRGTVGQSSNGRGTVGQFTPSTTPGHPSVNPWTPTVNSNSFFPQATTPSSFVSSPSIFNSTSSSTYSNPFLPQATTSNFFVSSPSVFSSTSSSTTSNPFLPQATTSNFFVSSPSVFSSTSSSTTSNSFLPNATTSSSFVSSPSIFNSTSSSTTSNLFLPKATTSNFFVSSPSIFSSTSSSTTSNPFLPQATTSNFFVSSPSVFSSASSSTTSNPFLPQATTSNFFVSSPSIFSSTSSSTTSNPFLPQATTSNFFVSSPSIFNSTSSSTTSNTFLPQATTSSSFISSPSIFSSTSSSTTSNPFLLQATTSGSFSLSPSIYSSTTAPGAASGPSSGLSPFSSQSSQVFHATSSLEQTNSSCGQGSSSFGPGNSPLCVTNPFASIQTLPSQTTQTVDPSQRSPAQGPVIGQPAVTSPFGNPHAVLPMSTIPGSTPSIQYGISSMPVKDRSAPTRISSLLTSKHLSRRQITVVQKYHPKRDGPKIPFYSADEGIASMPIFIPRENPRAFVISPTEKWPPKASPEKPSPLVHASSNAYENQNSGENSTEKESVSCVKPNVTHDWVHDNDSIQKGASHTTVTGHRAGEAAMTCEHVVDVKALMPNLPRHEYYTEPQIQELALKERAEPGFCSRVNDFVVGRHGYGSVKFLGETDVRQLDLNSLVQFNNREVIVYMDESKKPPVGQGLNKPAVVTLLNITCTDKKTGKQNTDGPKVDRYRGMLIKAAKDQGAEFVSYNPAEGEWKFKVQHFSRYMFRDDDPYEDNF